MKKDRKPNQNLSLKNGYIEDLEKIALKLHCRTWQNAAKILIQKGIDEQKD